MARKKTFILNFASLASIQVINYVLPLLTVPYLFKALGANGYGMFSFAIAFVQYFMILTDFGFNLSATKYIAERRQNTSEVNHFVNSAMLARMILALISVGIMVAIIYSVSKFKQDAFFYLLFGGMVVGNSLFPIWYFQGIEQMKFITLINIIVKLISVLPVFVFVKSMDDILWLPIFYSAGYLAAGICSLYIVYGKMKLRFYITSLRDIFFTLKDSLPYFLSRVSVSLFTTTNSFILGLAVGNVAVGYYSLAERVYQGLNSIYYPLSNALYPYMSNSKDKRFYKKVFSFACGGNLLLLVGVYFFIEPVLVYFFKIDLSNSLPIIHIFLLACLATVPSILLGYPYLGALGFSKYVNNTVMLSSVLHIVGLIILYYLNMVSIYYVAVLVGLTELLLLCFRIYGIKKYQVY